VAIGPLVANWRRRDVYRNADQISFHTTAGETLMDSSSPIVVP
jgi:hypothetical protein